MVGVRVPRTAGELAVTVPENRHELTACFDQSPRRQARLTEERHAVGLAQRQRLATDVEGLAHLTGRNEREGRLPELVEGRGASLDVPPGAVELLQERPSQVESLDG